MFEHRTEPLLSQAVFRRRLARHGLYALALVSGSLVVGTLGFWYLGGQPLVDAYLNSAMLLGGMGPIGEIRFTSGKLFAAFFALYAGLVFIGVSTILGAPVFHRLLHTFHLEEQYRRRGRASSGGGKRFEPPGGS
jgi:hypothetical protein